MRSLRSRVLRWPDADEVVAALNGWVDTRSQRDPALRAVGYIGSYARGDWGPGSDLDIVIVTDDVGSDVFARGARFDTSALPVPADLLVYTPAEFAELLAAESAFGRVLRDEARWVLRR